jgi:hypothetical protein
VLGPHQRLIDAGKALQNGADVAALWHSWTDVGGWTQNVTNPKTKGGKNADEATYLVVL